MKYKAIMTNAKLYFGPSIPSYISDNLPTKVIEDAKLTAAKLDAELAKLTTDALDDGGLWVLKTSNVYLRPGVS